MDLGHLLARMKDMLTSIKVKTVDLELQANTIKKGIQQ